MSDPYETLNHWLAGDACMSEADCEDADKEQPLATIVRRKLAEHREREAYQLVLRAERHLRDCNDLWEQRSAELNALDEVN